LAKGSGVTVKKKQIVVLRYGHRQERDYRVTTHCCLVARALGAKKIIIAGEKDEGLKKSVMNVVKKWGNGFAIDFTQSWRRIVKQFKRNGFFVIHLTMYGLPMQQRIKKLREQKKVLVIIGSQKVEGEVYRQSDANIAVTAQPHSEIAALAILLDWLQQGKELEKKFKGAKIKITPAERGKKVVKTG